MKNQIEEKEFNIEKNLYLIKKYKFQKDVIKKELNLDIIVRAYISEQSAEIYFNDKQYFIDEHSRIITFIDGQKSEEIFIYSEAHLKEVINKLEFKAFCPNKDEDSLDSENNKSEIFDIFNNIFITTIYKDRNNLDKIKENFAQRYTEKCMNISDLSLNSSFYYPNNNELNFKLLQKNFYNFKKFFAKECSILYIVGPKGISKSLFLLFYCHLQNWAYNYPLLYINYKGMINLKYERKKKHFQKRNGISFF